MTQKLATPRMRVRHEGPDGTVRDYDVQTDNRDLVRFDLIRERKGWPRSTEAPMLWMTVLAWHALKRSGVEVGEPEAFLDACVQLEPLGDDGAPVPEGGELPAAGPLA